METIINIILLEGVSIESKIKDEICLCHRNFTLFSLFPIFYLNPLLQLIINNRNEFNMNSPLCLGYSNYDKSFKYIDLNIKIDNNLKITGIINDKDIIFKYKDTAKNRFPICWLNGEIQEILRLSIKNYKPKLKTQPKKENISWWRKFTKIIK